MSGAEFSEQQLAEMERRRDPESVPSLVQAVRRQQHDLDSLRLSLDVAQRDREELRHALIHARAEIQRLRQERERGEAP